jgi:arginase
MNTRKISIIGVPMDLGQNRRGVDMGPSAIRYAGILEKLEGLELEV